MSSNGQVAPAANLTGPLRAHAGNSSNGIIKINAEISAGANPAIVYELVDNTSGASIVSKGPWKYDAISGIGTQQIIVKPGTESGSFKVVLTVTTAEGVSEASKSVTVMN